MARPSDRIPIAVRTQTPVVHYLPPATRPPSFADGVPPPAIVCGRAGKKWTRDPLVVTCRECRSHRSVMDAIHDAEHPDAQTTQRDCAVCRAKLGIANLPAQVIELGDGT